MYTWSLYKPKQLCVEGVNFLFIRIGWNQWREWNGKSRGSDAFDFRGIIRGGGHGKRSEGVGFFASMNVGDFEAVQPPFPARDYIRANQISPNLRLIYGITSNRQSPRTRG